MTISKSDISNLNDLINKLEEYRKLLVEIDYIHNKRDFFDAMKELRKFLISIQDEKLFTTLFHSKYFKFYKEFFTNMNMYYLRSIEAVQSISIMTKGIHNFDSYADLMDKEFIMQSFKSKGKELGSLDFREAKNLTMVGSGALPETLLYIYENYNIDNIVGVDYNHEAIFMAGEMTSGLNINDITFYQGNGTVYDYKDADIIYMPLFTFPKSEILNRIVETGKNNVQILIATPKGFGRLLFEDLGDINPRLKITNREDVSTGYISQEAIKLEIYDF